MIWLVHTPDKVCWPKQTVAARLQCWLWNKAARKLMAGEIWRRKYQQPVSAHESHCIQWVSLQAEASQLCRHPDNNIPAAYQAAKHAVSLTDVQRGQWSLQTGLTRAQPVTASQPAAQGQPFKRKDEDPNLIRSDSLWVDFSANSFT